MLVVSESFQSKHFDKLISLSWLISLPTVSNGAGLTSYVKLEQLASHQYLDHRPIAPSKRP